MKRGFEKIKAYAQNNIPLPERKTGKSAGYDIAAAEDVILKPGQITLVPTGLKAYMQEDEYLGIHIRSGLAVRHGLSLPNGQGIIDADYYNNDNNEGHILVAIINLGPDEVKILQGERIAQGIFYKYLLADGDHAQDVRKGGFGSTGTE